MRSSRWRVPVFFGVSAGGHLALAVVLMATGLLGDLFTSASQADLEPLLSLPGASAEPIDVTMIEAAPLNPLERALTEEEQEAITLAKLEEARKLEDDPDLNGQVVEIAKPNVEIRPDDTDLLSEYDSKVERETVARGNPGDSPGVQVARPVEPPPQADPAPPADPRPNATGLRGTGAMAMRTRTSGTGEGGDSQPATRAGTPEGFDAEGEGELPAIGEGGGAASGREDLEQPGGGVPGEPGEGEGVAPGDLRPSEDVLTRAIGSGSSDYLKDVDDGAETLLNTKRFKYASFFNRVKRAVAQNWHPDNAYRLRDPTGQIYGHKNRLTVLKVSLEPDGALKDVVIEKPCGVDFLDDEAISAFRAAQPFPNPPQGLVDKDSHLITFRFGFFFEISSAPSFRIFRYSN